MTKLPVRTTPGEEYPVRLGSHEIARLVHVMHPRGEMAAYWRAYCGCIVSGIVAASQEKESRPVCARCRRIWLEQQKA